MEKLGKGGYGTVWKVYDIYNNNYALKIFLEKSDIEEMTENDLDKFKEMVKENMNLKEVKDENIIILKGIAYSDNDEIALGIVQPLMNYDLKHFLEKYGKTITFKQKIEIALQISNGL